ncbi:hypothetical protein ACFGVR_20210 [Mucilaginibacter sp. AW1-3]
MIQTFIRSCYFFAVICVLGITAKGQVNPIKWTDFKKAGPTDSLSLLERDILLNTCKYGLTTWYSKIKKYDAQSSYYIDLGGNDEYVIRSAGSEAQAVAVALKTGVYNADVTGVPVSVATERVVKLIRSVVYHHKVNQKGGWGDSWQSALWAAYAGEAGWMMWYELTPADRVYLQKMVEYEANRFNDYKVPYLQGRTGEYQGAKDDSKSEENSWNAMILHLALAMMPQHPNYKIWMNKNIELMLSASARPQDVNSDEKFNGKHLKDIINGSNYNEDGTVTNHGRIHPDYMACTSQTLHNALLFALAEQQCPKAAFFNVQIIYQTLTDHKFESPPYSKPGGSIYMENSPDIYYPEPNDWGKNRKMHFALMDCQVGGFGIDKTAAHWEWLHAGAVLAMQKRSNDGSCYQAVAEDTYKSREEWVASMAAQAYLTKWLIAQKKFRITNKKY